MTSSTTQASDLQSTLASLGPALALLETLPEPQRSVLDRELSAKMQALLGPEESWSDEVKELMAGMRGAVEGSDEDEDEDEEEEDEEEEWETDSEGVEEEEAEADSKDNAKLPEDTKSTN